MKFTAIVGHQGGDGRSALLLALDVAFCKAANAFHTVVAELSITPGHMAQSRALLGHFSALLTCSGGRQVRFPPALARS